MANGSSRRGFLSSLPAKPTLFQASIENSEPTVAAPITGSSASDRPPAGQKPGPKLAARAVAFRPIEIPSTIRPASAAGLIAGGEGWVVAAVRAARAVIQVRAADGRVAKTRWG